MICHSVRIISQAPWGKSDIELIRQLKTRDSKDYAMFLGSPPLHLPRRNEGLQRRTSGGEGGGPGPDAGGALVLRGQQSRRRQQAEEVQVGHAQSGQERGL